MNIYILYLGPQKLITFLVTNVAFRVTNRIFFLTKMNIFFDNPRYPNVYLVNWWKRFMCRYHNFKWLLRLCVTVQVYCKFIFSMLPHSITVICYSNVLAEWHILYNLANGMLCPMIHLKHVWYQTAAKLIVQTFDLFVTPFKSKLH